MQEIRCKECNKKLGEIEYVLKDGTIQALADLKNTGVKYISIKCHRCKLENKIDL